MNIELTTENLRECCRFCLNRGEFNIWEQTEKNDEKCALDLLKIFKNYENDLLGLNDELKLLCQFCLENLKTCNTFYKKAFETNKQMLRLYREAEKIEAELLVDVTFEVLDNDNEKKQNTENHSFRDDYTFNMDECETNVSLDDLIEEDNYEESEKEELIESDSNESEDINSTFEDTEFLDPYDEDSADILEKNVCENERSCEEQLGTAASDSTMSKPSIMKPNNINSPKDKATRIQGPALPPHDDGSLFVNQFLPLSVHSIVLNNKTEKSNLMQEYEDDCSQEVTSINTVDFATVEVKSSNFQEIIEEEILFPGTREDSSLSYPEKIEAFGSKEDIPESESSVYICKYCPQAFTAINYLISHVRKSHVCKYCTKAFSKSMDLFMHIRQKHHQHICAICNKELSSQSNLRGHINRVHGIRLPAQVALLHYRPPTEISVADNDKPCNALNTESQLDEMGIHF